MPKSHPALDVEDYFVERLSIEFNAAFDPDRAIETQTKISVSAARNAEDETLQRVGIDFRTRSGEKANTPYQINFRIIGFFRFNAAVETEIRARMIGTNALPILYGIARGVIAQATAQFPAGKFVLPTVNFIDLLKREAQRAAIAAARASS